MAARRAIAVQVAGEARHAAAEDAGRLRDALGVPVPPGLPLAFLESVEHPLDELVARYARTHGPFRVAEVVRRLGAPADRVRASLERLEAAGRVLQGEFRPGGVEREWVDDEVLRVLRRRSLAALGSEHCRRVLLGPLPAGEACRFSAISCLRMRMAARLLATRSFGVPVPMASFSVMV